MKIIKDYCFKNDCYNAGEEMRVSGLMLHSIGTPQPRASVLVNNYNKPDYAVCVHGFIDAETGDYRETLPTALTNSQYAIDKIAMHGWHSGTGSKGKAANANNTGYIGIEMCESDAIKYDGPTTFKIKDNQRYLTHMEKAYWSAVEIFARLCKAYGLNPVLPGVIISHKEGSASGIASNHSDPEHYWLNHYTMEGFRHDVLDALSVLQGLELGQEVEDKENTGAFSRVVRYSGPVYKAAPEVAIPAVDGSYTIVETVSIQGNLWGRLKSGAGWIPIK